MSIGKEEVYEILRARGIPFEVTEHGAVWNMEDLAAVPLPYPSADAKNLFLRDEKKRAFYERLTKLNRSNVTDIRATPGKLVIRYNEDEKKRKISISTKE
jgi:Ala-tRNA(Pro) deacylase